jgi:hypothetical protein
VTAIRRLLVLWLAILLAPAPAAADTVITVNGIVTCSVESADPESVSVRLTQPSRRPRSTRDAYEINRATGQSRMIPTADIYEIRLSSPSHVAAMAALLPRTKVSMDSGQAVPLPEARAESLANRWAEVEAGDSLAPVATIKMLPRNSSLDGMAARCLELRTALTSCGRSDDSVTELLDEVVREERALRNVWSRASTNLVCGLVGAWIGIDNAEVPVAGFGCAQQATGCGYGLAAGCALGAAVGLAIGKVWRDIVIENHRQRVNDLVRRFNHTVMETPRP